MVVEVDLQVLAAVVEFDEVEEPIGGVLAGVRPIGKRPQDGGVPRLLLEDDIVGVLDGLDALVLLLGVLVLHQLLLQALV